MNNYHCDKCLSENLFIEPRGNNKALVCKDCGKWLKWVSKKELPIIKNYLERNNPMASSGVEIIIRNYKTREVLNKELSVSELDRLNKDMIFRHLMGLSPKENL